MKERYPFVFPLIFSLSLGLAPFTPEPHLVGKLRWILGGGTGMEVMDYFDLIKEHNGNLSKAFENTKTKFLVISFTSDWLYPTSENKEIVIALNAIGADVGFVEIESDKGHDSFLLKVPKFLNTLGDYIKTAYSKS